MSIAFSRLKMFRKQSGYTQEEVADKIGVSRQALAKWEKGDTMPDIESCVKLADLYETTVDMLVRNIGEEEHSGDGKHIFGCSKLNSKGQITLPVNCRKVFHLKTGDHLLIMGDENKGIALVNMGSLSGTIDRIKDKISGREADEE